MSDIKVNRVNRNFGVKVHLYHNPDSHNRAIDSTPRYYVDLVQLNTIEKVGFTDNSRFNDYTKHGHRFWKYKSDETLNDVEAANVYYEMQDSYPYGWIQGDQASYLRYWYDVHNDESFQSFYKTYWEDHADDIQTPIRYANGSLNYPYSYIEFDLNEIVTSKYVVGTIPALPSGISTYSIYSTGRAAYADPVDWSCHDENLVISVDENANGFKTNSFVKHLLKLYASGRYTFNLSSGDGTWPTGADSGYSGYRFRFSTGEDGSHNGYDEYTSGVSYAVENEIAFYHVNAITKTASHPQHGEGSVSGFTLSGSGGSATSLTSYTEGTAITLRRDSTYFFMQESGGNSGHPIYISTDASGASTANAYTSGVSYSPPNSYENYLGSVDTYVRFDVPGKAPDTLYYSCKNHSYMGGQINIVDAPTAPNTGSVPGEVVILNLDYSGDSSLYYYSPDKEGIGGPILIKTGCGVKDVFGGGYGLGY